MVPAAPLVDVHDPVLPTDVLAIGVGVGGGVGVGVDVGVAVATGVGVGDGVGVGAGVEGGIVGTGVATGVGVGDGVGVPSVRGSGGAMCGSIGSGNIGGEFTSPVTIGTSRHATQGGGPGFAVSIGNDGMGNVTAGIVMRVGRTICVGTSTCAGTTPGTVVAVTNG